MRKIADTPASPSSTNRETVPPFPEAHGKGSFAKRAALVFRAVRWTTYGSALIVLILLLHKAAPPPVARNAEAAARAEQKFADVQQAVAQGEPATLRMDETELNSYLATHLDFGASHPASGDSGDSDDAAGQAAQEKNIQSNVRDVKVQLIQDRVRAYVLFDVHGKDMTLRLEGRLGAENGFLKFELVSGQIGALPIPKATLNAAVRRMMKVPANRDKLKLPDEISDLRIENGEVVATYLEQ